MVIDQVASGRVFSVSDVAHELGCTRDDVHAMRKRGLVRATLRTVSGQYLFTELDVQRARAARAAMLDERRERLAG